jgi:asparagine synthase (glutamine-hydrolysing)
LSGICVVLAPNAGKHIKPICEGLRHRGTDNEGFFIDNNVALGHKALKITETSVVHQPLSNEDKTIWITFDGEIYNKQQLIQRLNKNHTFQTESSAEVVIHAYEEHGLDCLSKFNGMFAFCLWDSKKRLLFSAIDRMGMKSLYYHNCGDRLVIASEIKGILKDASIPRVPNKRYIYDYLVTGYPTQMGDTFFAGIKELMPAHYMLITDKQIKTQKYWQPAQNLKSNPLNDEEHFYSSRFHNLLLDSIRIRLPPNFPVGTFLSGGLDSTSIAFLVNNLLESEYSTKVKRENQELFSAIYKDSREQGDETFYIKEVERALKTKVNYVFPSVVGEWKNIERFVFDIEEPVAVFNYYVFWYLFKAAKHKVNTILSGQGCDAILGGQTEHVLIYFKELWKTKKIVRLSNELVKSLDWILPMIIWTFFFKQKAESKTKMLLAPMFVAAFNDAERPKDIDSLQNALLNDVTKHAVEYLRVDNRASSAFSVECRHPFLDHRIVEFAFSLPATQKIRDGWTKYVMRNVVKDIIPKAVLMKRKKFGTPIPQQRWMSELRRNIRKVFESKKFQERGYFNQPAILEVFDRYCEGKLNRIERKYYANMLWRILNLELWLEIFIDQK